MTTAPSPDSFIGRNAVDPQGNKIGSIGQVYANDHTGQPDWITINTGLFGMKESFAPLAGSRLSGDDLVLPFDKTVVKNSPDIADASHLDPAEQQSLNTYYQQYAGSGAVSGADRETTDNARQDTGYQQGAGRSQDPTRVGTEPVDDDRSGPREHEATNQQPVQVPVSGDGVTSRPAAAGTVPPGNHAEQLSRLDKLELDIAVERERLNTPEAQTPDRPGAQHSPRGQERADRVREVNLPELETKVTESQRGAWSMGYQAAISDAQSGKTTSNPFHPLR